MLYSLDEICLMPNSYTDIEHRSDVIIYNNHNKLPLFSAPMACVIDNQSAPKFEDAGINTIIPRNIPWEDRLLAIIDGLWVAVGLKEAQYIYEELADTFNPDTTIRLCIDQANGHMSSLYELCGKLKDKMGNKVRIMTGNIANPMAYDYCADAGIDYIRCGIGGGSACFVVGTKITTNAGYKNIEDIIPGDVVITTGGEKPVKNVFTRTSDTLITINNDITCTPDHKFLVINKSDKDVVTDENLNDYSFYIEASKLSDKYLLVQA